MTGKKHFLTEDGKMIASLPESDKEKRETSHLLCIHVPTGLCNSWTSSDTDLPDQRPLSHPRAIDRHEYSRKQVAWEVASPSLLQKCQIT